MDDEIPPLTRAVDPSGSLIYHFWADQTWEGFDSIVKYMQKYWSAIVTQSSDDIYSRTWELISDGVPIRIRHDSQSGNSFFRSDGGDNVLLDRMYDDLTEKLK